MAEQEKLNHSEEVPIAEVPNNQTEVQEVLYAEQRKKMQKEWQEFISEEDTPYLREEKSRDITAFIGRVSHVDKSPEEIESHFKEYKDAMAFVYNLPPQFRPDNVKRVEKEDGLSLPMGDGLPTMVNGDAQVGALSRGGNIWGMEKRDFGIGDYICHAYAVEVSPQNINSLLMALREIPTSDYAKLEQNRIDALAIGEPLRSFIHDQHPLAHDIIHAIVKYYETRDDAEFRSLLPKTGEYLWMLKDTEIDKVYDFDQSGIEGYTNNNEKKIEILRRLEKNTEKISEYSNPPEISDRELNEAIANLAEEKNYVPKDLLRKAMDIVNSRLQEMGEKGEIGIEPNMISAIAWLERKGHRAIRDMSYEDQLSAYKNPWFHSVLKFQELTSSAHQFNQNNFDEFVEGVSDKRNIKDAYELVMDRALKNIGELADIYMKSSRKNITGTLWSGNLTHELTALTDLKPASSTMGKKHRKEQQTTLEYRKTGD